MKNSKYLVRPNDMHIFEIDNSNGCYRSYTTKDVTDRFGNRPNAMEHFTYDNLTKNYNFFPINEDDIPMYEYFNNIYSDFMNWHLRPDGHDDVKGGTFDEFLEYRNIYKKDKF